MYETLIIGGGAAGCSAAVYACRAGLRFAVLERMSVGAGQISGSHSVWNYLGLPNVGGFELSEKFRQHALSAGAEFIEGEATEILSHNDGYRIRLSDGRELDTLTVVYATGASHRKLCVEGEKRLEGRGVSYCAACDGSLYRGKRTAVVGGGDTALGYAVYLSHIAESVIIIHRRNTFRANIQLQSQVRELENAELCLNTTVSEILGDECVCGIRISQNGKERIVRTDAVFIAIGEQPQSGLIGDMVAADSGGFIIADENGITSAPGIFAAGDVRAKAFRQLITAAADGACCINSVEEYLARC